MRAYVGVTDDSWAEFLRQRPDITEVNFWQPSATALFGSLPQGGPFLFKTHWPSNRLVGGGFFSGSTELTIGEAWELFGEGNGVASLDEFRRRIAHYRKRPLATDEDPRIGCLLLRDVFFPAPEQTLEAPPDFAKNIVRGKGYDLAAANGSYLERALEHLLQHSPLPGYAGSTDVVDGPMFGLPQLVRPRAGQRAFQALVQTAYHRRCAITGARITPTLQAAHIRPVSDAGENRVDNGLLLRSDVHTLFDRGYLGVDQRYRLHVSPVLREDFGNGAELYDRAGTVIDLPDVRANRPSKDAVTWHMDTVFKAS